LIGWPLLEILISLMMMPNAIFRRDGKTVLSWKKSWFKGLQKNLLFSLSENENI
jgi:hypothetical protein